ncbi:hypothetical protein BDW72DRAFT_199720 [Aspergillus terricola var. indicus]
MSPASATATSLQPYAPPQPTKENLNWATLSALYLPLLSQPGGKETLAKQVLSFNNQHVTTPSRRVFLSLWLLNLSRSSYVSVETNEGWYTGFFYVTNHGLTPTQINRQYAIAKSLFALPLEEKLKYVSNTAAGDFRGTTSLSSQRSTNDRIFQS